MGVGGSASGSACGPVIVPVFKTGGRQVSCHRWVRLPLASAIFPIRSISKAGPTESRRKIAVFKVLFQPHWRWGRLIAGPVTNPLEKHADELFAYA